MQRSRSSKSPTDAFDAGDEGKVAARKSRAQAVEEQRINGLRLVMESPDSRAWLWGLLAETRLFSECFTGNSETFFNEGKRGIGLRVFNNVMEHFPDLYMQMAKEGANNV